MDEKRMLILPLDLVKKIDENRGDMSVADFIEFLIDCQIKHEDKREANYVTREELKTFEDGMRELFRSFLDFFLNFGLELGRSPQKASLGDLNLKLQELEEQMGTVKGDRSDRTKWK